MGSSPREWWSYHRETDVVIGLNQLLATLGLIMFRRGE